MPPKKRADIDLPASERKRKRSPSDMTPVGRLLEALRLEREQTLADFAKAAGVSHSVLSAVAYGRKKLTPHLLDRLERNLKLSKSDIEWLRQMEGSRELLTDSLLVPIERLIRREAWGDVK